MVAQAFVRQFAAGQKIDLDVADQEVVLHYALARLNEIGLVGYPKVAFFRSLKKVGFRVVSGVSHVALRGRGGILFGTLASGTLGYPELSVRQAG